MAEKQSTLRSASIVADVIREEIFSGSFPQGSPLREVGLADRLGVSRRTIRESLLLLASDGLVTHRHNQGASVRVFEADDVRDLYRVRRLLEVEGARAVTSASDAAFERIERAFEDLKEAALLGFSSVALAQADTAFHGAVISLLGSPQFDGFYQSIAQQIVRVITLLQETDIAERRDLEAVVMEHHAIYEALRRRDAWEARRLVLEHIDRHEQNLLDGLDSPRVAGRESLLQ